MNKINWGLIILINFIFIYGCYLVYSNHILIGIILMMWGNNMGILKLIIENRR